jgi:hypothetical protein
MAALMGIKPGLPARRAVSTTVHHDGITHDFMMLNPLSDPQATRATVTQAIAMLRDALQSS